MQGCVVTFFVFSAPVVVGDQTGNNKVSCVVILRWSIVSISADDDGDEMSRYDNEHAI